MNSRHIIAEAWHFTRSHKNLMWWYAFIPSILTTLIGILYLTYQFFAFKRSALFEHASKSFLTEVIGTVFNFLNAHGNLWIPAVVTIVIVLVLYALLPTLCQGALIQIIARTKRGEIIKPINGISLGLLVFLPLLEYHLLVKSFSIISLFTEAAFVLRNLGFGALKTLLPVFIAASIIGLILTLLFTYSEFFIVLEKKPVLKSMMKSGKLVVLSWQHTFLILILMMLIALRVVFNILAVLLVPALLFFTAGFIATVTLAKIGLVIGIILSLFGLLAASYFTGVLNVFSNAVWTLTFLALMEEKQTKEFLGE